MERLKFWRDITGIVIGAYIGAYGLFHWLPAKIWYLWELVFN